MVYVHLTSNLTRKRDHKILSTRHSIQVRRMRSPMPFLGRSSTLSPAPTDFRDHLREPRCLTEPPPTIPVIHRVIEMKLMWTFCNIDMIDVIPKSKCIVSSMTMQANSSYLPLLKLSQPREGVTATLVLEATSRANFGKCSGAGRADNFLCGAHHEIYNNDTFFIRDSSGDRIWQADSAYATSHFVVKTLYYISIFIFLSVVTFFSHGTCHTWGEYTYVNKF